MKTDTAAYRRKRVFFQVEAVSLSENRPCFEEGDKPPYVHARRAPSLQGGFCPEIGPDCLLHVPVFIRSPLIPTAVDPIGSSRYV